MDSNDKSIVNQALQKGTYLPFKYIEISLQNKRMAFLYRLLAYVEHNKRVNGLKGFNKLKIKSYLNRNGIVLDTKTPINPTIISRNQILFASGKNSALSSLLCHIRNAFAHNNIKVDKGILTIQDWRPNKTCSMYGIIEEKKFFSLIMEILNQKEKQ